MKNKVFDQEFKYKMLGIKNEKHGVNIKVSYSIDIHWKENVKYV